MKHNKLVRDKIPDIILADGREVSTKILSDKDFKVELEKEIIGRMQGSHRIGRRS